VYAIIEDSGTQIKVTPGQVLEIDLHDGVNGGGSITFDRVLMIGDAEKGTSSIGTPYVKGASVSAEVIEEFKGPKLDVIKYKRRKGYKVKQGHRQRYLRVKIGEIKG
jgi:large subunit ribosomal protein L21